jgi:SOS-response transcriptional repressor LexA
VKGETMMEINLPPGQKKIASAIQKLSESGRKPTMREIKDFIGARSLNIIFQQLALMERKGVVKPRARHAKRAIELTEAYAA